MGRLSTSFGTNSHGSNYVNTKISLYCVSISNIWLTHCKQNKLLAHCTCRLDLNTHLSNKQATSRYSQTKLLLLYLQNMYVLSHIIYLMFLEKQCLEEHRTILNTNKIYWIPPKKTTSRVECSNRM